MRSSLVQVFPASVRQRSVGEIPGKPRKIVELLTGLDSASQQCLAGGQIDFCRFEIELRANAAKLAANQRAAIDARIAALNAQVDEAKARLVDRI